MIDFVYVLVLTSIYKQCFAYVQTLTQARHTRDANYIDRWQSDRDRLASSLAKTSHTLLQNVGLE
jgi:hypothetical protein